MRIWWLLLLLGACSGDRTIEDGAWTTEDAGMFTDVADATSSVAADVPLSDAQEEMDWELPPPADCTCMRSEAICTSAGCALDVDVTRCSAPGYQWISGLGCICPMNVASDDCGITCATDASCVRTGDVCDAESGQCRPPQRCTGDLMCPPEQMCMEGECKQTVGGAVGDSCQDEGDCASGVCLRRDENPERDLTAPCQNRSDSCECQPSCQTEADCSVERPFCAAPGALGPPTCVGDAGAFTAAPFCLTGADCEVGDCTFIEGSGHIYDERGSCDSDGPRLCRDHEFRRRTWCYIGKLCWTDVNCPAGYTCSGPELNGKNLCGRLGGISP